MVDLFRRLDYIEQHFIAWLKKNYTVNVDNGSVIGLTPTTQLTLELPNATDTAGKLRTWLCFERKSYNGRSFSKSPNLKVLFVPNEGDMSQSQSTGMVIVYDDKAKPFSKSRKAYHHNHDLLATHVSNLVPKFVFGREPDTYPNKVTVLGIGNVKVDTINGQRMVTLLDFTPMNRVYNLRKLRRLYVKQQRKEYNDKEKGDLSYFDY